jgi:hypothetical protein
MSDGMAFALAYGLPVCIGTIIFGVMVWIDYYYGGMPPPPEPPDFLAILRARDENG